MPGFRVGVDIGGTFTDIVFLGQDGTIHTKKVSSSIDNYARAISTVSARCFRKAATTAPASRRCCMPPRWPRTPSWS